MRDRFERSIVVRGSGATINGGGSERLCNTSNISFDDIESQAALMLLDRHQVCCSAGSACKTGSSEGSHVLRAMHLGDNRVRGSLRFSLGRFNSEDEVERATVIVPTVIEKRRSLSAPALQGTLG
jgi:cysteine desulfurase